MQLSIIIPTRNRVRLVEEAARSLIEQDVDKHAYEIIIVDDGSTDDTCEVLNSLRDQTILPRVKVVSQSHKGANAARNFGIIESKADWLFFMDDDEVVPAGFLGRLFERMQSRPDLDAVGGPYRNYGGSKFRSCAGCNWATATVEVDESGRVERLLGGNMLIRKEALSRIGDFSETMSGYGDESEWFARGKGKLSLEYDEELWLWHRRDGFSFLDICVHSFRQGRNLPRYRSAVSQGRRAEPVKAIRSLGHAVKKRCIKGVIVFFSELGAIYACINDLRRDK